MFYAVSWNGTPWVVCSEVFPGSVRTVTQMTAAASNWFWNFVISRATPTMFLSMVRQLPRSTRVIAHQLPPQGYGVYLFFGTMMMLSIPFIVFLLPETMHVPYVSSTRPVGFRSHSPSALRTASRRWTVFSLRE